jgi:DNA helicase II / ATP-dependent DNA helicase PcrA
MSWDSGLQAGSKAHSIASSTNERVRVVAGPGTGKSFAMKRRVARLLEGGVAPKAILPVTFTRVAAEDLHRELVGMNVPGCEELKGATLHSLALKVLTRQAVLQATGRVARPLNEFELEPMVCDLMVKHGGKRETKKRQKAYEAAWARLQHETPGYVPSKEDGEFQADLLSWLRFHRAMLIGEAIPQLYDYLRSNPMAPERTEFSHILVDEFQDLNKAEQGVIDLLSDSAEVCIVGDDDQSIYSFKHAHPEGIRDWCKTNASADDLSLDECRRCPTLVVDMANSLISHNKNRTVRDLVPVAANGPGVVKIVQYKTLDDETNGVAQLIRGLVSGGTPAGDILVLAQRRVIGTPIYDALTAAGVPARSYYAEAEIASHKAQAAFALLKLFIDRDDRVALRWLVGDGGNNWYTAGYSRVRAHCEQTGLKPWEVFEQLAAGTLAIKHTASIVASFTNVVARLAALQKMPSLADVIDVLFPSGDADVQDIREIAVEALAETGGSDPGDLMAAMVQAISQPEIPDEVTDVRIMSLHKSKGLSAAVTIVAGCVEGLLPQQPDPGTPTAIAEAELEEQRRLFFVGITRVKSTPGAGKPGTLILTYCREMSSGAALRAGIDASKTAYGKATLLASRFIKELGNSAPAPVGATSVGIVAAC